jgi:hypothetical protein
VHFYARRFRLNERVGTMDEGSERRAFQRHQVRWSGKIFPLEEPWYIDCWIADISDAGACVHMRIAARLPPIVVLLEHRYGLLLKSKVIWQRQVVAGLQFVDIRCRQERRAMLERCFAPLSRPHEIPPLDQHTPDSAVVA